MQGARGEEGSDKSFLWGEQGERVLECWVLEHAYVCMCVCVHQKVLEKASEQCDCVCVCGYF